MFTAFVIVFREVFEMAIIIAVVLAATKDVQKRALMVSNGIICGAGIVGVMAFFAKTITEIASKLGQHVFHALVLFVAAILIAFSVIWMQQHGKKIVHDMQKLGTAVSEGATPLYMLSVVVALAVVREGSEIVLFLYGIYIGGEANIADLFIGFCLGLSAGVVTGVLMYAGLIRMPVKFLFQISGVLLAFLSAGMVAKCIGHLIAADIMPALIKPIWDTSWILSQRNLVGRFLSVLIGYQDQPAAMQVIFYVATLFSILFLLKRTAKKQT